nr:hypothetical protein [Tanacetum cinerariifolium]
MSSFYQRECFGCGQPCDGHHCYSCACPKCRIVLFEGICINCTYGDGKPVTYNVCEGPLRGGFCLFCDSRAKNSYIYDPNAYSFNNTSNNFNHLPQPQFETYLYDKCGNNSYHGYDCQPQLPFVYKQEPSYNQNYNGNYYPHDLLSCLCYDNCGGSHATFQCQPIDQNIDSSGFDQIQSLQYPVNHHISQVDVEEVLQDKEKFMQVTQTFLEKFNRFSFRFTLRVLTIAWERIDKIKYVLTKPEEIPELMYKLREDVQNIREELAKYIDSVIWNCHIFFYEEDEDMGYEHLNTTSKTESDEIIKSGVEELLPIPREYEVTSEDKRECNVPVCENSPICYDHSEIFSDSNNNDDISSDDDAFEDIEYVEASLPDPEIVSLEEENVEEEEVDLEDIFQIQDVILCEKLLSINRLIADIESLNDNPTPDCVLKSFTIFEEFDNSLSDNSSPEFETFSDQTEETSRGSTTAHDSLPENDSFCFEIEPDQEHC